jgi:hypothetical protein
VIIVDCAGWFSSVKRGVSCTSASSKAGALIELAVEQAAKRKILNRDANKIRIVLLTNKENNIYPISYITLFCIFPEIFSVTMLESVVWKRKCANTSTGMGTQ